MSSGIRAIVGDGAEGRARLKIARLPDYAKLVEAGKKAGAVFLDLGCCGKSWTCFLCTDIYPLNRNDSRK